MPLQGTSNNSVGTVPCTMHGKRVWSTACRHTSRGRRWIALATLPIDVHRVATNDSGTQPSRRVSIAIKMYEAICNPFVVVLVAFATEKKQSSSSELSSSSSLSPLVSSSLIGSLVFWFRRRSCSSCCCSLKRQAKPVKLRRSCNAMVWEEDCFFFWLFLTIDVASVDADSSRDDKEDEEPDL